MKTCRNSGRRMHKAHVQAKRELVQIGLHHLEQKWRCSRDRQACILAHHAPCSNCSQSEWISHYLTSFELLLSSSIIPPHRVKTIKLKISISLSPQTQKPVPWGNASEHIRSAGTMVAPLLGSCYWACGESAKRLGHVTASPSLKAGRQAR